MYDKEERRIVTMDKIELGVRVREFAVNQNPLDNTVYFHGDPKSRARFQLGSLTFFNFR